LAVVMRKSIHYIVDAEGHPSAAVVDIALWKRLLAWMEDQQDVSEARAALAELETAGNDAERAGWLRWDDVRGDLDE
jgi:hypothetical protein